MYSGAWQKGVTAGGCRNNSGKYDNDDQFDHCHGDVSMAIDDFGVRDDTAINDDLNDEQV